MLCVPLRRPRGGTLPYPPLLRNQGRSTSYRSDMRKNGSSRFSTRHVVHTPYHARQEPAPYGCTNQMHARLALIGAIVASASGSQNEFTRRRPARRLSPGGEQAVREWRSRVFDDEPPTINVDYVNHPFAHATTDSDGTRQTKEDNNNKNNRYKPLRIHFDTSPLENLKGRFGEVIDKRIDLIIQEVLPVAGKTWTDALSVVPINAKFTVPRGSCGGAVSESFVSENTDLTVIVTTDAAMCNESGTTAAAFPCAVDQFDRPIMGVVNFCLGSTMGDSKVGSERAQYTETALHELGHLLGFVDEFIKYWRDPDSGRPLTPRPFEKKWVSCVDGKQRFVIQPPYVEEGMTASGARYFDVTTQRVQQVVRNQFDCQGLRGARLETQPTATSCFGSHLDERLYFSELMGAIYTDSMVLSALTLAFLEDSGLYQANYTNAGISPFGHRAGCDFVQNDCIVDGKVPEYAEDYFCDTPLGVTPDGTPLIYLETTMCDPSRRKKAACDLIDRSDLAVDLLYGDPAKVPAKYSYFDDGNLGAAQMPLADFCPVPAMMLQDCRDDDNSGEFEEFGDSSFCYTSLFRDAFGRRRPYGPLCLKTSCNAQDRSIEISKDGRTVTCGENAHGERVQLPRTSLQITCPRFEVVCADLVCPANCSGRGICKNGTNGSAPRCECFDTLDNSAGCFGAGSINQDDFETEDKEQSITPRPTAEPTKAPKNKNKEEKNEKQEQDDMTSTMDPTRSPTYDTSTGDGDKSDDSPTIEPTLSPVITLYGDAWVRGSSASTRLLPSFAFILVIVVPALLSVAAVL